MSVPAWAAGVPPHQRVALALLRAWAPPAFAPDGYNDARGRLWVRMLAHRAPPTSAEFEDAWRTLEAALRAASAGTPHHPLHASLRALDDAWGAAFRSGLLDAWERD